MAQKNIIFLLLTFLSFSLFAHEDLIDKGHLSVLWAQELTGADLAKERLRTLPIPPEMVSFSTLETADIREIEDINLSEDLIKCKKDSASKECLDEVGNLSLYDEELDGYSLHHGSLMLNLILHPTVGTTEWGRLGHVQKKGPSISFYDKKKLIKKVANDAKLVCLSSSDLPTEFTPRLKEKDILVVLSAGNSYSGFYPEHSPYLNKALENENVVLVGNLAPIGTMTFSSAYGDEVWIGAPSQNLIQSSYKGQLISFGGTSAAQPLVCGALINVYSLLPGIKPDEAKELLKKTALPTENSREMPQLNGSGSVNAFKLVEVALKLRKDWPHNRNLIFDNERNDKIYNFSRKANQLYKNWQRTNDLNELRKAVFLEATNQEYVLSLVEEYQKQGFSLMASFIKSFMGHDYEEIEKYLSNFNQTFHRDALRALMYLVPRDEQLEWIKSHLQEIENMFPLNENQGDLITDYFTLVYHLKMIKQNDLAKEYFLSFFKYHDYLLPCDVDFLLMGIQYFDISEKYLASYFSTNYLVPPPLYIIMEPHFDVTPLIPFYTKERRIYLARMLKDKSNSPFIKELIEQYINNKDLPSDFKEELCK